MEDNWKCMMEANIAAPLNWADSVPMDIDFDSPLSTTWKDACNSPLVTNILYAPTLTCAGKHHCSTALDDSVPFIEKSNGEKLYLYESTVWPSILRGTYKKCME